jgi:signal transduction histidine kinase
VTTANPAESTAMCSGDELRKLFLFEKLTDDQLTWLCREGRVIVTEAGQVYREGDPAAYLYVLMSGTVVLTRRIGQDEVEVNRTSNAGVYAGAFFAYLGDRVAQVYNNSLRTTERSRFFVLEAGKFAGLMADWFPMATHLLEGLFFGTKNTQEAIGQRERLLALGSLSAGLTHELNNPAAAAVRATAALREKIAGLRDKLAGMASGQHDGAVLATLIALQEEALGRQQGAPELTPLEASDAESEISDWLDDHDITDGWKMADALVQAGFTTAGLDKVAQVVSEAMAQGEAHAGSLAGALHWLADSGETEGLLNEITDSVGRISHLVSAAKQYSQLDRAPFQVVSVHELLDSTLAMLGAKFGPGLRVVKEYGPDLPPVPGFPAELNQVWTNLIDNAVAAMNGSGTLTIRTALEQDRVLVEVADTGPGIPPDLTERIFEPFFTTKPVGQGTGLGLDISWRIVVNRHHGDLRVQSAPGDTRFDVRLPITAPAEAGAAPEAAG